MINATKYLKWYRHFRAHMQDPETARDSALLWMYERAADIQDHKERYKRTAAPAEPTTPTEAPQAAPQPRKRRRTYTDPTTPNQPTLF